MNWHPAGFSFISRFFERKSISVFHDDQDDTNNIRKTWKRPALIWSREERKGGGGTEQVSMWWRRSNATLTLWDTQDGNEESYGYTDSLGGQQWQPDIHHIGTLQQVRLPRAGAHSPPRVVPSLSWSRFTSVVHWSSFPSGRPLWDSGPDSVDTPCPCLGTCWANAVSRCLKVFPVRKTQTCLCPSFLSAMKSLMRKSQLMLALAGSMWSYGQQRVTLQSHVMHPMGHPLMKGH